MCLSQPPTFTNATYAVYESSPIGTAVGTVKATPANFEQQIDYAVRGPSARARAAAITMCSPARVASALLSGSVDLVVQIVAQYPLEINGTFTIGSCSGMILVANPDYLVWRLYKNFTITVRARPDGESRLPRSAS